MILNDCQVIPFIVEILLKEFSQKILKIPQFPRWKKVNFRTDITCQPKLSQNIIVLFVKPQPNIDS